MQPRRRFLERSNLTFAGSMAPNGRSLSRRGGLPRVRRVGFSLPELPTAFDGLVIAQVSDVHAGPYMTAPRMRAIRDLVASLQADLIVFTGDQVDRRPGDAALFARGFRGIAAPLGVFGILGNHDHLVEPELAVDALVSAGISPLVNETAVLSRSGARLALVGLDEISARHPWGADFSVLGGLADAFRICLCHQPRGWHEALAGGAHLTLSGHTHGGQIALTTRNLNIARLHTRYIAGPYRRDEGFLYVSRGIGVGAVPLRFGAPPEVDLITLRRPLAAAAAVSMAA